MSYAQTVINDAPVHYWKLQGATTTAVATVGGVDGSYDNATPQGDDSHVEPGSSTVVFPSQTSPFSPGVLFSSINMPTGDFSIEMWFKIEDIADDDIYRGILNYETSDPSTPDFGVGYERTSGGAENIYVENPQGGDEDTASVQIDADTWYYFVLTYDSSANQYFISLNDTSVATIVATGSPGDNDLASGGDLRVSYSPFQSGQAFTEEPFDNASFGHLAIYDTILTATQISTHYALGNDGFITESAGGDTINLGADKNTVFSQVWS